MVESAQHNPSPVSESSFLVVGVVRNCEKHVREDVMRLKDALRACRKVQWLLIESDSDDQTRAELDCLSNCLDEFNFISLGKLSDEIPLRTARIARCRNVYLEQLRTHPRYAAVDYVVVADFDGLNTMITREAIESCWKRDDWDACTANQAGPYYDIWALRHDVWCPNDCWRQYQFLQSLRNDKARNVFAAVYSKMLTIPAEASWIKVHSAFGGLAIYKRSCLQDGWYIGHTEQEEEVCEHIALNASLGRCGCNIYINTGMINAGITEHSAKASALFSGDTSNREVRIKRLLLKLRKFLRTNTNISQ